MDEIDRQLLGAVVGSGRMTLAALGDRVGLSAPAVHDRIHKLEAAGVIRGYTAILDPDRVERSTAALVFLRLDGSGDQRGRLEAWLTASPDVLELHEVAGEDCYVAKVRVSSPAGLAAFLHQLREEHAGLTSRSSVVLRSCFERPLLWPADQSAPVGHP